MLLGWLWRLFSALFSGPKVASNSALDDDEDDELDDDEDDEAHF